MLAHSDETTSKSPPKLMIFLVIEQININTFCLKTHTYFIVLKFKFTKLGYF
jgi:hypothetical protein